MPALASKGRDLSLQSVEQGLLDVVWDKGGNPEFDDSEAYAINTLLDSRAGEWFADPTGKRGSRMAEIRDDEGSVTVSKLESAVRAALTRLVDSARIAELSVKASNLGRGKYLVYLRWKSRGGKLHSTQRALEF